MLSEILEAAAPTSRDNNYHTGITMSSLFPCPYRLRLVHDGRFWSDEITPQQYYNMSDGHDQEDQSVRRLEEAGIRIRNRQKRVYIGESKVPGHYDGDFELNGVRYLWEHKAYDAYSEAVQFLKMWGMDKLPSQKAQTNAYMLGGGLEWCDFFVKVKNNNTYIDLPYQIDRPFIEEIIEWCDRIRLDNWKPEPLKCRWCTSCGVGCFGSLIDFSWIGNVSTTEMAERWLKGDKYEKVGSMLKNEARTYFIGSEEEGIEGVIGSRDVLMVEGLLEIKKVVQHRFDIKRKKVLEEFGPEGLMRVGEEKEVVQYRFRGVE